MRHHISMMVPTLLALALALPAAEHDWTAVPDGAPPAGWTTQAPASATVRWHEGALELAAASNQGVSASTMLDGGDGSDDQPLRIAALVSADGERPLSGQPAWLAVRWANGAVFAVGLGEDPHTRRDERRAWAAWSGSGQAGDEHAEAALGNGATPAHLRIVVTSGEVAAYGSRDGWTWVRVAGVARSLLGAAGAPQRLVVGRGKLGGETGLTGDPPSEDRGRPCIYRFAALRVEHGSSDLPASLLRNYAKQESLGDTLDALAAAGRPQAWRLRGPEPAGRNWPPTVLTERGEGWTEHRLPDGERVLQLARLLPGAHNQVRWAETTLTMPAPGWQRLLFDGTRLCWLWVNGRLVSSPDGERDEAEPDRQAVLVWLPAGEHRVTLALRGGSQNASAVMRWENGDPRFRIALLGRLLIDFPDDEGLLNAPFEVARLWEGQGFSRTAAVSLSELAGQAGGGERVERALAERARLFSHLRDEPAAAAEIAVLSRLWQDGEAGQLGTAVRTAQLWQRLDVPERALGALAEALALPDLPAATRCDLHVERARLRRRQGDAAAMADELVLAAQQLPARDERAAELLALAVRHAGDASAVADRLAQMGANVFRLRLLAGAMAVRGDADARLAARRRAAALPADGLDAAAIDVAEQIAAADPTGALTLYRQELARLGVAAPANLGAARSAHLRAVLSERQAGASLVEAAAALTPAQANALSWHIAGPVPLRDWQPHESPDAKVLRGPEGGPVGGKPWRAVTAELMQGDTVDLNRVGMGDNAVVYLAATLDSPVAVTTRAGFAADDALAVWLNGERIHADRTQRGIETETINLQLKLRAGSNLLVCAVQNGGGASAFRFQMRREPWPASEIAEIVRGVGGAAAERAAAGTALTRLVEGFLRDGQLEKATALARAVIRCWPDDAQLQWRIASQVLYERAWTAAPGYLTEVARWFDHLLADRAVDNPDQQTQVRSQLNDRLLEAGLVREVLTRLRRSALTELDPGPVAQVHLRESDLWLRCGSPRLAVAAAAKARIAAAGDEMVEAEADRRAARARSIKGEFVTVPTPFEVGNLLRTAERAATTGDGARAASDWQKVIEDGRDQPVAVAHGRIRGAATFAIARLRQAGAAVLEAWHQRHDVRAAKSLEAVKDEADPAVLERVAERWPLAPAAGEALERAAGAWSSRGDWALALGAAESVLPQQPAPPMRGVLVRAVHAAARAGDVHAFARHAAALGALGGSCRWDGAEVPAAELVERLRRMLPVVASPDPRSLALHLAMPSASTVAALPDGDGLIVASLSEIAAVAGDGTQRWRIPADPAGDPGVTHPSLATPSAALSGSGDCVVAVQLRQGVRRLVAVQPSTGRPLWLSSDVGILANLAVVSAPLVSGSRVYAWFADRSRALAVCLDARDGSVLWSSACGAGPLRQPIAEGIELDQGGDAPAPLLLGRDLIVATDAGQIACFDAVHGALRWIHVYPRTALPGAEGAVAMQMLMRRMRSPIVAGSRHVFVAPRDSLALLAIDRSNGALAWSVELADAQTIVGAAGDALITAGEGLTSHDQTNGNQRWRWEPAPESPRRLGRPALTGDAVWTATAEGLQRVALADGTPSVGPSWRSLGLEGEPPDALMADSGRILASGRSGVAVLGASGTQSRATLADPTTVIPTGATVAAAGAAPVAIGVLWEIDGGPARALVRPQDAKPGECYALAGGRILRLDAVQGAVVWSTPVVYGAMAELQVVGDAVLLRDGMQMTLCDRASGSRRWQRPLDPELIRSLRADWQPLHARLDADGIAVWRWRDNWFASHAAGDGAPLLRGRVDGWVVGVINHADEVHVAFWRNRALHLEVRARATGERRALLPLGLEGNEHSHSLSLDDGSLLIAGRQGAVLWRPSSRQAQRIDLGMEELSTYYRSGGRWIVVGRASEGRYISAVVDPVSGALLSRQELTRHWSSAWQERIGVFDTLIGDTRVRAGQRGDRVGILGVRADGSDAFWISAVEAQRRSYHSVAAMGDRAIAIAIDRDGTVRGQMINPAAGAIEVESALSCMPAWPPVRPIEADGRVLISTVRGLAALAPLSSPLPAAPPIAAPKLERAPIIDGQLEDWPALPAANGVHAHWAWNDEAAFCVVRAPLPPGRIARMRLALDLGLDDFRAGTPLLLALDWGDGVPRARVVSGPMTEDPARAPIVARAASPNGALAWELRIPWVWLRENGRRPGREDPLRAGVALWPVDGTAVLEWGGGLGRGSDPTRLLRLRLEDGRR